MCPQNSVHPHCIFKLCPVSEVLPGGHERGGHTHAKLSASQVK